MKRPLPTPWALLMGGLLWALGPVPPQAHAESLSPLPAVAEAPNPALEQAKRYFEAGNYAEAIAELKAISEDDGHFPEALSYRARSFDALGLSQLALFEYTKILDAGREHPYFEQAFDASAALSRFLGQDQTLGKAAGKLGTANLPELERHYALYAGGLYWYEMEDFEKAVNFLGAIPRDDALFVKARLQLAKALIPLEQRPLALAILQDLLENEGDRLVEIPDGIQLATLSYARMAYGMGLFDQAADYYARVSRQSPYWGQALMEQSWTQFALWQFQDADRALSRALGTLQTLLSPALAGHYFPEAYLLEAQIFFLLCKSQSGGAIIERFLQSHKPVHESLTAALAEEGGDPLALYENIRAHRQGEIHPSKIPHPILNLFLSDPTIDNIEAHIALIEAEKLEVSRQTRAWSASDLEAYTQRLDAYITRLRRAEGEALTARLYREATLLIETIVNTELAQLNLLTQEVQMYEAAASGRYQRKRKQKRRWTLPSASRTWPFEGEYWKDELGTYLVQTSSECGAIQR